MLKETTVTITAHTLNKNNTYPLASKFENQKVKFTYDENCQGEIVEMTLIDGVVNEPNLAINFPHAELKRVLKFLLTAEKK